MKRKKEMSGQHPESDKIDNEILERIIKSRKHWQTTVDAVKDYIFVIDKNQVIKNANLSFASRFQRHPREIIGIKINDLLSFDVLHPDALSGEEAAADAIISKEVTMSDGTYVVSVFPAHYDDEQVFVYVMKDVTELIDLKKKLYHAYKLASLGRLVSGVAHELNNPLTGILGYTEILSMKVQDEATRKDLDKIYKSAERCKVIIDSLLCFSRQQSPQRNLEYIHAIIDKTLELRAYWHRTQKIEVVKKYDENIPLAYIDTQQIQQVILNIVMNAEQAIAESGRTGKIIISAHYEREKSRIIVGISDNGTGISRENIPKIFEPFFTTKPVNKGTGLGLSISYGIVLEHGGTISVESIEGEGATFIIELPLK
jgi:two-component system NtrC family sensor kinase